MKKGVKIFLIILAFIIAALSAFCIWQRENLRAVYMYLTVDEEALVISSDNITGLQENGVTVIPEVIPDVGGEERSGDTGEKSARGYSYSSGKEKTEDAVPDGKSLVEKCRSELYACEAQLVSRVSGMRDEVLAQWRALSPEERTARKKREMIVAGIGRCLSLEGEVDGKVKAIIAKYKQQAKSSGKSTAEIDSLWDEYTSKKASTKAYYLNKYLG